MENKAVGRLVFDLTKERQQECSTIVRISPKAAMQITAVMRKTGMTAKDIISRMIDYGCENIEIKESK